MPTRRSKEIPALIARLKAIAFAEPPYSECVLSIEEVRMLVDEMELNTGLAKAAITARIQRPPAGS